MISSVSRMYPTAVICFFWARDSFCVAHTFWLPCHISTKSWTLAILCNLLLSASFSISKSLSVFVVSHCRWWPATILVSARANCPTTPFSRRVLPVIFDCLQPITSQPREKLHSTPKPCCMIGNMPRIASVRSAYFESVSSCYCHHSLISGNQHLLPMSIGSE